MYPVKYVSVFAAAFAVQQLTELLDSLFMPFVPFDDKNPNHIAWKKAILKTLALLFAWWLTAVGRGRINILAGIEDSATIWYPITVFAIAAGTDGVNSILKFMTYSKENQKVKSADQRGNANAAGLGANARS